MSKPTYAVLRAHHHSSDRSQPARFLDGESLYKQIGHNIEDLKKQNPAYENTCAVRMSIAFLKAGVAISGRLKVKAGPLKGRSVEPGAKLLADQLCRIDALGKPQILKPEDVVKKIDGKQGVAFFWKMAGYSGGHIDLIDVKNSAAACGSACYLSSREIWFWPLH